MKKISVILVALAMILSLAACGGAESSAPASSENAPAPQSSAAPASSSVSSAASSEAPAPAPAPAPAVDPAELGCDPFWYPEFEIAVPEPPFKSSASENGSDILVINADSGEEITYPEMLNYCGLLMDLGYDNVAVLVSFEDEFTAAHKAAGAATLFEAKNAAGQTVRVYKEESTWMVFAPRFDSDAEPKSSDTSDTPAPAADAWMYDNHLMPIPEPPYGYSVDIGRESYEIRTENVDEVRTGTIKDITDYCETLKAAGFTEKLSESQIGGFTPDRPGYSFSAKNAAGDFVELLYDGNGYMLFVTVVSEPAEEPADEPAETPAEEPTASAADNLPELPAEFNWAVMDHPDAFVYEAQCADPQWVESYVNDLKALGYELVDESHDGDWVRIRLYHSAEDHVVYIEYNEKLSYTYAEIGK